MYYLKHGGTFSDFRNNLKEKYHNNIKLKSIGSQKILI